MQELFSKKIDSIIDGLDGVVKSTDDFLVFGKDKAEHDKRLQTLLERLKANHVTLNKEKCEFNKSEVEFIGHRVSDNGVNHYQVAYKQYQSTKYQIMLQK